MSTESLNLSSGTFLEGASHKYLHVATNKGYRFGVRPYVFVYQEQGSEKPFIYVGVRGRIEAPSGTSLEPDNMQRIGQKFGLENVTYKGERHASVVIGIPAHDPRARKTEVAEIIEQRGLAKLVTDLLVSKLATAGAEIHLTPEALLTFVSDGFNEDTEDKVEFGPPEMATTLQCLPAKGWL